MNILPSIVEKSFVEIDDVFVFGAEVTLSRDVVVLGKVPNCLFVDIIDPSVGVTIDEDDV